MWGKVPILMQFFIKKSHFFLIKLLNNFCFFFSATYIENFVNRQLLAIGILCY